MSVLKNKRLRRFLLIAMGLIVALLAMPFLFTTAILRYYLTRSGLGGHSVHFRSATLSPLGALTINDVEVDDTGESAGRKLLTAERVQVGFGWLQLGSGTFKSVVVENLELWLHPGKDTPLTLLRLMGGAPARAAGGTPALRLWSDEVLVTGHVWVAGYEPWLALAQVNAGEALPVQVVIKTTGSPGRGAHDVSLIVGEAESSSRPFLTARFTVQTSPEATTVNVERLNLGNGSPAVTEAVLGAWPGLPAVWRRTAAGHFDRIILSGSTTLGRETTVNATAELRDFSGRAGTGGEEVVLENLSAAAHAEGRITATPLQDLKFSRMHCTWDALQAGEWRVRKGVADFQVDASEVALTDLQASVADAQLAATAALDPATGLLTRGRLWVNGLSAPALRERLPGEIRSGIPDLFEGALSARIFLSESDADHMAAYVELACPDELTFNMGTVPEAPSALLANALLSGTVSWNLRADTLPQVSHGRLTADELEVIPAGAWGDAEGTSLARIKSDFNISADIARLDDFYADLAGNGQLAAEGNYTFDGQSLDDAVVRLNGIDLALANPWLPEGWTLAGQADAEIRGGISARTGALAASLNMTSPMAVTGPGAKLAVTGVPPVAALRLTMDRRTGVAQVQTAEISGLDVIQADAGMMQMLRQALGPAPGSVAALVLDRCGAGAFISVDKVGFSGHVGPSDAAGTVALTGLDLGPGSGGVADNPPVLLNLSLKANAAVGLGPGLMPDGATLRLEGGDISAARVTVGRNALTGLSGSVAADNGKATLTHAAAALAEGKVEGDATVTLGGRLESMHLGFAGVRQQALLRELYPEVLTAEGAISGKLALERGAGVGAAGGVLTGAIEVTADGPGRLKLSAGAAAAVWEQAGKGAVPLDEAVAELADYPYAAGKAVLRDSAGGMLLTLDYAPEGGAGWALQGDVRVGETVTRVVGRVVGK